jgi:hypothetical protein
VGISPWKKRKAIFDSTHRPAANLPEASVGGGGLAYAVCLMRFVAGCHRPKGEECVAMEYKKGRVRSKMAGVQLVSVSASGGGEAPPVRVREGAPDQYRGTPDVASIGSLDPRSLA